jgi:hypothetical protein
MKVTCHYKNDDQPIVCAFPAKPWSIIFRLCSGDVLDPYLGNWFKEPYFKVIIRFFTERKLPYFAWRFNKKCGYIGFQAYGVDSEQYLNFLPAKDVFDGSQALSLTFRPFATFDN